MARDTFYVRVVVHGEVRAENAGEAIAALCDMIRAGIGPEPRKGGVAIGQGWAGSAEYPQAVYVNEDFLSRWLGFLTQHDPPVERREPEPTGPAETLTDLDT